MMTRRQLSPRTRVRIAAPSIRRALLASCWPRPQQQLPASATGGGRCRCRPFHRPPYCLRQQGPTPADGPRRNSPPNYPCRLLNNFDTESFLSGLTQRPLGGTGSKPHRPSGLHRAMRQAVSSKPLMQPWVWMASMPYWLQVGVKRQLRPSPGLIKRW